METVEKATTAIPAAVVEERSETPRIAESPDGEVVGAPTEPKAAATPPMAAPDPWSGLL
jgi:hypothetical protein